MRALKFKQSSTVTLAPTDYPLGALNYALANVFVLAMLHEVTADRKK